MAQTRIKNEIKHFTNLEHIWWGARTVAGQKRYDFKFQEFKKFTRPTKSSRILEIGCGDGEFTRRLAKLGCQITATDVTPAVVRRGQRLIKNKKVRFLTDNAEAMRFKDRSFDIVCGISILHHINSQKAIKETFRVLTKGGQLFFTEPNLLNPIIAAGLNIKFLRQLMEYSPDETALIRWQMAKKLRQAGFSQIRVINYDFLYPQTPASLVGLVKQVSSVLEKIPLIKEFSGSLIIWARK